MIKGIDTFKTYFHDYKEQYVLIGGAACDIIFQDVDTDFRATKDLDIVLIAEALTPEFGKRFWEFIQDGGYEHRAKSNGSPQFFRFDKPKNEGYPYMLELFSKTRSVLDKIEYGCIPLHLDDEISSLSAILLNSAYYQLLLTGKTVIDDVVILTAQNLIPFKAKAWLDLSERKAQGQHADERDIRKHKNDVVRLTAILSGNERCELPDQVKSDMEQFINQLENEPIEPKVLKITGVSFEDIILALRRVYL
jgi:hypothetical protein